MTMVVVDHNMSSLMELVDRVVVLHNGAKLAEGTPEEIAENKDVQEAYLSTEGDI
jgi:branched-chain amino acid transport system ATP-binding protein